MPDRNALTTGEVARLCEVTDQAVRNWIEDGKLSADRVGRHYFISRAEFDRFTGAEPVWSAPPASSTSTEHPKRRRPGWLRGRPSSDQRATNQTDSGAQRFYHASDRWEDALQASWTAPPDARFAARLRDLATAASERAQTCMERGQAGFTFPSAQSAFEPPYELRPGTGRRGPEDLWREFDQAAADLTAAGKSTSMRAVGHAYQDLADVLKRLATAVEQDDKHTHNTERVPRLRSSSGG